MTRLPIALACVLAACGGEDTSARAQAPSAGGGASSHVRDFCGAPDEARIRAAHPELPRCGDRAYTYLQAQVGGHPLLAIAHGADPCCTDTGGMDLGAHVYVDGRSWSGMDPILLPSPPADASEAMAWLQAELMRLLVVRPAVDAAAVRASWSDAARALERHALGLERTAAGWRLRAASVEREQERGIDCRSLVIFEAELSGTRVTTRRVATYGAGEARGAPCPGDPLP